MITPILILLGLAIAGVIIFQPYRHLRHLPGKFAEDRDVTAAIVMILALAIAWFFIFAGAAALHDGVAMLAAVPLEPIFMAFLRSLPSHEAAIWQWAVIPLGIFANLVVAAAVWTPVAAGFSKIFFSPRSGEPILRAANRALFFAVPLVVVTMAGAYFGLALALPG